MSISVCAEFERELIRERTIEGLSRAKSQGKKVGRPNQEAQEIGLYLTRSKEKADRGRAKGTL